MQKKQMGMHQGPPWRTKPLPCRGPQKVVLGVGQGTWFWGLPSMASYQPVFWKPMHTSGLLEASFLLTSLTNGCVLSVRKVCLMPPELS